MVNVKGFHYQPVISSAAVPQGMSTASQQAASTLKNYVAHLTNKDTGEIKKGVLYLRANQDGSSQIMRDRAYHLRSRSGERIQRAGEEIKTLFKNAYQDRMDPRQYAALERSLNEYLSARSGQMGTKSLVRFHAAFEQGADRHATLTAHARALPATVTAGLAGKSDVNALLRLDVFRAGQSVTSSASAGAPADEGPLSAQELAAQRLQGNANALMQAYGEGASQASLLGKGGNSNAFLVKAENMGSPVVVTVPMALSEPLTLASLGTGELAAASARAPMPHVAKPTAFLLRVKVEMDQQLSHRDGDRAVGISGTQHETYEVPTQSLHAFLQVTQAAGAEVTLSGVKMPAGPGPDLKASYDKEPIDPGTFLRLASGLYQGLQEMALAGLVHHDVKPQNVTFDPRSGQVMLIDTGAAVQLDPKTQQTSSLPQRTEKFTSPKLTIGLNGVQTVPHGADADRYACAMTLMCTLSPTLMKSENMPNEAMTQLYLEGETHPQGRIGAFLQGLDDPKGGADENQFATKVAEELRTAFQNDPLARSVLEHALAAGMTEQKDSDKQWSALAKLLKARGADVDLPGNASAVVQPESADAQVSQAMSMLPAGDPKREARFVLPMRTDAEMDPFDNFELQRRASFYEDKA